MPEFRGSNVSRGPVILAEGWSVGRLSGASRLFGANGLATGPDGRIHVAQVSGSQISAIGIDTGIVETICAMGGDIVAPDDLVFDVEGNSYVTEITEGRVSMREPNGKVRVLLGDVPVANPITFHQGRLIAGECRVGGRILEVDRDGGAPRIICENVPMPNAFAVGPDGKLYFPVMGSNEIWRVSLNGGAPEVVAGKLGVPTSVKFDAKGQIVSTQVATGQVLKISPETGTQQLMAQLLPGLDNLCFADGRLIVSHIGGSLHEILDCCETRDLVSEGLNWPLGIAVDGDELFVADGAFSYIMRSDGQRRVAGHLFSTGYPGYSRGVALDGAGCFVVTTALGDVARYWPDRAETETLASGFKQLYGVAVGATGEIIFADWETGRVHLLNNGQAEILANGLDRPKGVAINADGRYFVAESGAGRISEITARGVETLIDGLVQPEGIAVHQGELYGIDVGQKILVVIDLHSGIQKTVAANLPVGAPVGVVPKFLGPIGDMSGPMGAFAGVAISSSGTIFISADGEGSVMTLHRR